MPIALWKRLIYLLFGICLYPVCWLLLRTIWSLLGHLDDGSGGVSPALGWMLGGFLLEVGLFFTLPRPMRTYVLAHELTHALWGVLMGAKVKGLKVSKTGGSVCLTRTNVLIVLAPYFFPFYTMLVIPAYYLIGLVVDVSDYELFWLALVGFTWAFHLTFTVATLLVHQPDVQIYGRVFSYGVIAMMNLAGVTLWIVAVSSATFADLGMEGQAQAIDFWVWILEIAEKWRNIE